MTLHQAIDHYGSREALAAALGVKIETVVQWFYREEHIPISQQRALQLLTRGRLKSEK